MPPQSRKPQQAAPRPPVPAPPPVVIPPAVPIPAAIPPPAGPVPVEPPVAVTADLPVEPPPFDPDDPQPGQYVGFLFPHAGYTAAAIGWPDGRTFSVRIDPDTDCITELIVAEVD